MRVLNLKFDLRQESLFKLIEGQLRAKFFNKSKMNETKIGFPITQGTMKEIQRILSFARQYDKGESGKEWIVEEIENTLRTVSEHIEEKMGKKGKSGGLSSLFKSK